MSTSTTESRPRGRAAWHSGGQRAKEAAGFSLIELLLGLSLALCVGLGVAPVWVSSQSLAARAGDETVWMMQGRVAVARLERDLRLAGAQGCLFPAGGAVLQATSSQVVLLVGTGESSVPLLVEWEVVNGSLMRRWGTCPPGLPAVFSHLLYSDSKTMLENVDVPRSSFSYLLAGSAVTAPVSAADLLLVDTVSLQVIARTSGSPGSGVVTMNASGLVGR